MLRIQTEGVRESLFTNAVHHQRKWKQTGAVFIEVGPSLVVTAAYSIFQTRDNLSSFASFRCINHKDYPFNAEYWRCFLPFSRLARYASAVAWVVYIAFLLHQILLFPFFFSPTKMQYMYSVALRCFLFWEKEMLKWFWRAHCVDL